MQAERHHGVTIDKQISLTEILLVVLVNVKVV